MNRKQRRLSRKLGRLSSHPSVKTGTVVVANFLAAGLKHHQAGRLAEAEACYRRVLVVQPDHANALHLLGVVYSQRGNHTEAICQIDAALKINPQAAFAHIDRGNALMALQRFDEALASYDKALLLKPDYAEAFSKRGAALKKLKRLDEALASYDKALALKLDYADAFIGRGNTLQELRRLDEALASYDNALALKPDYAETLYNRGLALHELKRLDEALASYDRALALQPNYADAHNNRGLALQELKRPEEALASYDKALALKPDYAQAFNNRGNALTELKRLDEALASYDRALALKSDYAQAFNNRAAALVKLKRHDEALASYDRALALKPDYAETFINRGNALMELKRFGEALASYDRALALKPNYVKAFFNRGNALMELNRLSEALANYDKALALKPDYAETFINRGNTLKELKRLDEALASYDRALALKPDYAEAFYGRGKALQELQRLEEALMSFERAIALKPDYAEARFALCMAELPILYENESEIIVRRKAYERRLLALCEAGDRATNPADLVKGVGSSQPFYLAYQGYNDRDLQALYGSFVCRVMASCYPSATLAAPPGRTELVRVGIVSGFFWRHSALRVTAKGWLSQLDRQRFRVFGYHTTNREDAETKTAASFCERFVQGPLPLDRWRQEILADAPHVLIYPELGMDPTAARLAAQRLAPVQCTSWGHPETSGFSTIDYFLSSDLMEPPDGQDHYTERLVRLPNLSTYLEPLDISPVSLSRSELGLRPTAIVYWCGQSLFKYLPQFDHVFPRIAREAGNCQFAFIQFHKSAQITQLFWDRLVRAFAAFGLRATDYCVMWPPASLQLYVAAIGQCDIVLDSIGWSGGNTTLDAMTHDLPIVTMPGPLMRGCHSMAILQMMGVIETIANTIDDYVSIAIRLAGDAPWRAAIKSKISTNKHRIYFDRASISGLERFLNDVARPTLSVAHQQ